MSVLFRINDIIHDIQLEIEESEGNEHYEYILGLQTALEIVEAHRRIEEEDGSED